MSRWLLAHDVVKVYEAATEVEALLIQRILEDAGIPVIVRSYQVPGYGDIIQRVKGLWGDILVSRSLEKTARQVIADHLQAMTESPPRPEL